MINKIYENIKKIIKENIGFLLCLAFIFFLFNFELPYSIETPGGYISLDERIKIDNNDVKTNFGMAYVSMIKGNIPFTLVSFIIPDWDLVKKSDFSYDNESMDDVNKRQKLYLNEAVSNATYSAYKLAGKDVEILDTKIYVSYNDNENSSLKVGDNIISVNNKKVTELKELQDYLDTLEYKSYPVKVIRNDKEKTIDVSLKEYNGHKRLGVTIINNYELSTNPSIEINSKKNESGPSGGLMMALTTYDKLMNSNLSKGDKIIGTGTISLNGEVGEIGGVKYKLLGAVKNKAKVFICPKENYEEASNIAKERNYDIIIKDVETLNDAINYLKER